MACTMLDGYRTSTIFLRNTAALVLPPILDVSFYTQNWKNALPTYIFEQNIGTISPFLTGLLERVINANPFMVKKGESGFLSKIQFIFPVIAIPAVTFVASRCFTAAISFFVDKRQSPYIALCIYTLIFKVHELIIICLSSSGTKPDSAKGSLLSLRNGLSNLLFSEQDDSEMSRNQTLKTHISRVAAVAKLATSIALCSRFFVNRNPFWVSAAVYTLIEVTQQLAIKILLQQLKTKA
jgi:hypothetical protein